MTNHDRTRVALTTGLLLAMAVAVVAAGQPTEEPTSDNTVPFLARAADVNQDSWLDVLPAAELDKDQVSIMEDWMVDVNRRADHQARLMNWALSRGLLVSFLVVLEAFAIAYLFIRLSELSRQMDSLVSRPLSDRADKSPAGPVQPSDERPSTVTLDKPRRDSLPRVQFCSDVLDRLVAGIHRSRQRRGNVETGYALVGKIIGEGPTRIIRVTGLIDEGPNATRTFGHIQFDRAYQQDELCLLQLVDTEVMHIGDAHLHPGNLDTCSGGDYATDVQNVRESHSQEMVFVIATMAAAHAGRGAPESLRWNGVKLDFYYLGKATGYQYDHFRPDVVEGKTLAVPEGLAGFAKSDPIRTRLDFDSLRRLTNYRMTIREMSVGGPDLRPCLEMAHRTGRFKILILFSADPKQRPEIFVERGGRTLQFQPAWLNGSWLPDLVWFTAMVLDVERGMERERESEREITGRQDADTGSDVSSPASGRSAPAEGDIPGPRTGDDHGRIHAITKREGRGDSARDGAITLRQRGPGLQ